MRLSVKCLAKIASRISRTMLVLTKSSVLTPDDRIALGTIKRYGLVADAIIMVGGLSEALEQVESRLRAEEAGTRTRLLSRRMMRTRTMPRRRWTIKKLKST